MGKRRTALRGTKAVLRGAPDLQAPHQRQRCPDAPAHAYTGKEIGVTNVKPKHVRNVKIGGSNFCLKRRHRHVIKSETATTRYV